MANAPTPQMSPQQANDMARMLVLGQSIEQCQSIFNTSIPVAQVANTINIPPRNVGLIKGFFVEVSGTLTNSGTANANLTPLGVSNIISRFQFNDLQNNVRINCPGWAIALLDSAKNGAVYGGAYAPNVPMGYGNNWNVFAGATSVAFAPTDVAIKFIYYVPLAYAADDLRGAIYANVVNATMNLAINLNTTPGYTTGDPTPAIYGGVNSAVNWKTGSSITLNVYQLYLNQIPMGKNGPVLPLLDLSTFYDLKDTVLTGIQANNDFPIPYPNFRTFLSSVMIFVQAGTTLNVGSDVAYLALQSANYTNLFKVDPYLQALFARLRFLADVPAGCYYFDYRRKPLATIQYGNLELVLNASTAAANSYVWFFTEAFGQLNTITQAGSLPGG